MPEYLVYLAPCNEHSIKDRLDLEELHKDWDRINSRIRSIYSIRRR